MWAVSTGMLQEAKRRGVGGHGHLAWLGSALPLKDMLHESTRACWNILDVIHLTYIVDFSTFCAWDIISQCGEDRRPQPWQVHRCDSNHWLSISRLALIALRQKSVRKQKVWKESTHELAAMPLLHSNDDDAPRLVPRYVKYSCHTNHTNKNKYNQWNASWHCKVSDFRRRWVDTALSLHLFSIFRTCRFVVALSMMDYSVSVTPAASIMKSQNKLVVTQVSIAITSDYIIGTKITTRNIKITGPCLFDSVPSLWPDCNMGGVLMGTSVPWLKCLEYFGGNSRTGLEHVNQHSLALEDIPSKRLCRWS